MRFFGRKNEFFSSVTSPLPSVSWGPEVVPVGTGTGDSQIRVSRSDQGGTERSSQGKISINRKHIQRNVLSTPKQSYPSIYFFHAKSYNKYVQCYFIYTSLHILILNFFLPWQCEGPFISIFLYMYTYIYIYIYISVYINYTYISMKHYQLLSENVYSYM